VNLKQLKFAFDNSDGDIYFLVDDPTKEAVKKKLTTPPLQGRIDITIKKREDGKEIVYLPKSKMNIYAFEHLLVINPKEDVSMIEEKAKDEKDGKESFTVMPSEPKAIPKGNTDSKKDVPAVEEKVISAHGDKKSEKQ
jgi:hypothetical protein